jgi:hypothetical protein
VLSQLNFPLIFQASLWYLPAYCIQNELMKIEHTLRPEKRRGAFLLSFYVPKN